MGADKSETRERGNRLKRERGTISLAIRLEKQVWKAARGRNAKAFQKLVPDDAIMIFQSGLVTQPEYLATMAQRTIGNYKLGPIRGFMPNSSTIILHYEARRVGRENGITFPKGKVIESTTWIKRGARWLAILNQETPITERLRASEA